MRGAGVRFNFFLYLSFLRGNDTEKILFNSNDTVEKFYLNFLKDLSIEERKNIYTLILEKIELFSLKNGTYENKKTEIEKAKNIISGLK